LALVLFEGEDSAISTGYEGPAKLKLCLKLLNLFLET